MKYKDIIKNEKYVKLIIERYKNKLTLEECADGMPFSSHIVKKILIDNNIEIRPAGRGKFSLEKVNKMHEDHLSGLSLRAIAKKYKTLMGSVHRVFKKNNLKIKTVSEGCRKYTVNDNMFEKIDSKEMAYILGYIYADGYNNEKDGGFEIVACEKDKDTLLKIKKILNYDGPLHKKRSHISYYKDKKIQGGPAFHLKIRGRKISHDLKKLGCYQNKSLTLKFPTSDQVPDHLIRHFIRGYFDGDGCISIAANKKNICSINASFACSHCFAIELQNFLQKNNIKCGIVVRDEISILQIGSINNILRLAELMYCDSNIYMNRKLANFIKIFEIKNKRNKRYDYTKINADQLFPSYFKLKDILSFPL